MTEILIETINPIDSIPYFRRDYNNRFRKSLRIDKESTAQIIEGLGNELIELHSSMTGHDDENTALEIADVAMMSLIGTDSVGKKFESVPIFDGVSVKTFSALQEKSADLAKTNGYTTVNHNLIHIMENIAKLQSLKSGDIDGLVELCSWNNVYVAMIMSHINYPMADVMAAKHARNIKGKYRKELIDEIMEKYNFSNPKDAMAIAKKMWDPANDVLYLRAQLNGKH